MAISLNNLRDAVSRVNQKKNCKVDERRPRKGQRAQGLTVILSHEKGTDTCLNFREGGLLLDPGAVHFECDLVNQLGELVNQLCEEIGERAVALADIACTTCPVRTLVLKVLEDERKSRADAVRQKAISGRDR
jgi:hypothetical protein